MKKLLSSFSILAVIIALLAGCGVQPLSEDFDETEVKEAAISTVDTVNSFDYESVVNAFRADLSAELKAEDLQTALQPKFDTVGEFVEVTNIVLSGIKDKNTNENYAVAIVTAKYKSGVGTFTITFDKDLNLVGLYLK